MPAAMLRSAPGPPDRGSCRLKPRHLFLFAALSAAALPAPAAVAAPVAVRDSLTARTYPSARAPSAGRLPAKTPLRVLGRTKDVAAVVWLELSFRKTTGWVPASRTKPAPKPRCPSRSTGSAGSGRLFCGKLLPATTSLWVTYHPLTGAYPNSRARRWGADSMLARIETVTQAYWQRFRNAPRIVIGDISLRRGGSFGAHASHQQGLDVDVYYPRRGDGRARPPRGPGEVDRRRAQWLVERFALARAQVVFVGVQVGIRRTRSNIKYLGAAHETHFHVRFRR